MFDPARDDDVGHRRFYTRLLVIVAVGCLASVALWPSLSGFEAGSDGEHSCIAIVDALRRDSAGPGAAEDGACTEESRHRFLLSAAGLGAIAIVVSGAAIVRTRRVARTRTNLRHSGTFGLPQ